jgi:hypothetical protein
VVSQKDKEEIKDPCDLILTDNKREKMMKLNKKVQEKEAQKRKEWLVQKRKEEETRGRAKKNKEKVMKFSSFVRIQDMRQ